jgi:acyl-CoA thioesterase FadM
MVRSLIAVWIAVAAAFAVMPARAAPSAEPVAAADARAVHGVVAAQLDAFAHDDAARAFSYAAPAIQAMFQTPERFVAMVRAGYPVVYRAAGATFLVPQRLGDDIVQGVHLSDGDGAVWLATYRLERQRDGSWRINGCDVQRASGKTV